MLSGKIPGLGWKISDPEKVVLNIDKPVDIEPVALGTRDTENKPYTAGEALEHVFGISGDTVDFLFMGGSYKLQKGDKALQAVIDRIKLTIEVWEMGNDFPSIRE